MINSLHYWMHTYRVKGIAQCDRIAQTATMRDLITPVYSQKGEDDSQDDGNRTEYY